MMERDLAEDLAFLLKTEEGKHVLRHLVTAAGYNATGFCGSDTISTAYQLGRKSVANDLIELIKGTGRNLYGQFIFSLYDSERSQTDVDNN